MSKYRIFTRTDERSNGYESEYEDDNGTIYRAAAQSAMLGASSRVRIFENDEGKKIAVIAPHTDGSPTLVYAEGYWYDRNALDRRFDFAEANAIDEEVSTEVFYFEHKTYRMIMEFIEGQEYSKLKYYSMRDQLRLFYDTVKAFERLKDSGWVHCDVHNGNIKHYFNRRANESRAQIFDGDQAAQIGTPVAEIFAMPANDANEFQNKVAKHMETYTWHAPEVYYHYGQEPAALADPRMDIPALGDVMLSANIFTSTELRTLLQACKTSNPDERVSLKVLLKQAKKWFKQSLTTEFRDIEHDINTVVGLCARTYRAIEGINTSELIEPRAHIRALAERLLSAQHDYIIRGGDRKQLFRECFEALDDHFARLWYVNEQCDAIKPLEMAAIENIWNLGGKCKYDDWQDMTYADLIRTDEEPTILPAI